MSHFFFWRILLILLSFSGLLTAWEITEEEAQIIAKRVYANECSSNAEKLVWWNEGEHFASLGIGHFIWYPAERSGPFEETFPALLCFLKERNVEMPAWLKSTSACPWHSKVEFVARDQESKKKELQAFLLRTLSQQAQFIAQRFEKVLPELYAELTDQQKNHLDKQIERLGLSAQGKYALLDYLNFKGSGNSPTERYHNEGWGLKQVLLAMSDQTIDPLASFTTAAKEMLNRRVRNAPKERNEERWLPGWLARIDSYSKS